MDPFILGFVIVFVILSPIVFAVFAFKIRKLQKELLIQREARRDIEVLMRFFSSRDGAVEVKEQIAQALQRHDSPEAYVAPRHLEEPEPAPQEAPRTEIILPEIKVLKNKEDEPET